MAEADSARRSEVFVGGRELCGVFSLGWMLGSVVLTDGAVEVFRTDRPNVSSKAEVELAFIVSVSYPNCRLDISPSMDSGNI